MASRPKQLTKATLAIICAVALVCLTRFWYLEDQGNFHPITPGEAYRSAQLDPDKLEYYIKKYGIRSVINLRGKHNDEKWYADEIDICRKIGVSHFDSGLSARRKPSLSEIQALLNFFKTAPRPALIHCQAGADRAGLAAALWKIVIDRAPKSEGRKQLSILFGHMPFGPTQALDEFIDNWQSLQESQK